MASVARSALLVCVVVAVGGCGARTRLEVEPDRGPGMDAGAPRDASAPLDAGARDAGPDARDPDCLDEPGRCDDGDACTLDDCLPDGTCASQRLRCDDGDACTAERCDPVQGCLSSPTDCDDDDVCTIDSCDAASGCVRERVVCDDADPCTRDSCDARLGCVFAPTDCRGCADGIRDGFLDLNRYPDIAACAGGWDIPGLARALSPTCDRGAGDDGPNPSGRACSAPDLCAPGWHVCISEADVASHSVDGCVGLQDAAPASFFATRQTGPGCGHCATGTDTSCVSSTCRPGCAQTPQTSNDFFGCGDLGAVPAASSCGVLDRFSNNRCSSLGAPWRCDEDPNGLREADVVVKPGPLAGGVLCCLD